ncbi:MAG: peptide deformylase [Bdellovibrionales bacterium]|nr:peptide deformylase [Bdellovibrionales bacterium]
MKYKTLLVLITLLFSFTSYADNLEIIQIGHPTLRAQAEEVHFADIQSPAFQKLVDDMISTMGSAGGVGLAAPQVNKSLRIFVMKSWPGVQLTVVINPKVEYLEEFGKKDSVEGCLSIPGKNLKLKRFKKIHISYFDRKGEYISKELDGFGAIIAQHEYDHLNGILIVDLVEQMFSQINFSGYANAPLM